MAHRRALRGAALAIALLVFVSGCGGGGSKSGSKKVTTTTVAFQTTGSVSVNPLFVSTSGGKSTGGTNPVTVRLAPSSDGKLRVGFNEDEVGGTGDQWRAAGWGAVTVATLLAGAPLNNRDVEFDVTGKIDGPSAGGLMTVATIALLRGDKLQPDITMTGTINPDGTIGPVGGIPYKVDGVLAAHKKRMLIPEGQRNSEDDSGRLIDVVQEGQQKGVDVTEVKDVYDAYKAFTGVDLPRPAAATDVKLDEQTYQKLKAKTETWLAKYQQAAENFRSLAPEIQNALKATAQQADATAQQAKKLSDEGLQAGAFQKAIFAAALANAAATAGQQAQVLATQGADAFISRVRGSASVSGQVSGLVDELNTFQPQSVSDAGALVAAFANAIDAVSLSVFADNLLNAKASSQQEAAAQALEAAVYYELAGSIVDASRDILDVTKGLSGAPLGPNLGLNDVADFFRRGGEANLNAFDTLIIEPAANDANVSLPSAKASFQANDIDYALAVSGLDVMGGLQKYFGNAASSDYAELGGALALYNRSAGLLAKYYSLGDVDPKSLQVTGIKNDQAYQAAIDLAQQQLAGVVGVLQSKQVNPVIPVADNELAGVDREGEASDKISALTDYWDGYLNGRVLAYLGGFPATH
jgi:hypothetical protein